MNSPLQTILKPGFEAALYAAAVAGLADHTDPLRLNSYAYAIRELTRHILHRLGPEAEVVACSWYKPDPTSPGRPTRSQRAQYAIQGGLSEDYVRSALKIDIDGTKTKLMHAINQLSKLTHIEESVFAQPQSVVDRHVKETEDALNELCETIRTCRAELLEALSEQIDEAIIDAAISDTILEVDELASHHSIDEVYVEEVEVVEISAQRIRLLAQGTVGVGLQWGSNSDVARDDGATMDTSFPFSCNLSCPVDDPSAVVSEDETLVVDTSSWKTGPDEEF
jgi:hypothetical protein